MDVGGKNPPPGPPGGNMNLGMTGEVWSPDIMPDGNGSDVGIDGAELRGGCTEGGMGSRSKCSGTGFGFILT